MPFDLFGDWTSVAPHHIVAADVIGIRKKIVVVVYAVCVVAIVAVCRGRREKVRA